jgi:hypothetical protein
VIGDEIHIDGNCRIGDLYRSGLTMFQVSFRLELTTPACPIKDEASTAPVSSIHLSEKLFLTLCFRVLKNNVDHMLTVCYAYCSWIDGCENLICIKSASQKHLAI